MNKNDKEKDLKKRTKTFAIRIIRLVKFINQNGPVAGKIIANGQLLSYLDLEPA